MAKNGTTLMALGLTLGILLIIVAMLFGMGQINNVERGLLDYLRISDVWYVAGVEGFALLSDVINIMLLMVGLGAAIIGFVAGGHARSLPAA